MEAGTLHCQSCGATVGENDLRCPYCNSQLATLACPRCFTMVSIHASHCSKCGAEIQRHGEAQGERACPECKAKLFHTSVGTAHLDQCHGCGGVWVAQDEFEKLAADREERGEVLGALPGGEGQQAVPLAQVRYRPCPDCGRLMNRTNYGHLSGIIVDVCKDHGLWFDRDELQGVIRFIEKGGLDRNRQRELQELEEKRHMPAPDLPQGEAWSLGGGRDAGGGLIDHLVRGLFGF